MSVVARRTAGDRAWARNAEAHAQENEAEDRTLSVYEHFPKTKLDGAFNRTRTRGQGTRARAPGQRSFDRVVNAVTGAHGDPKA